MWYTHLDQANEGWLTGKVNGGVPQPKVLVRKEQSMLRKGGGGEGIPSLKQNSTDLRILLLL